MNKLTADKIKRRIRGKIYNGNRKIPIVKIEIEVTRDITKTCNANLVDRSL